MCALKMSVKILIVCSIIVNCALEETPDTLRHRLLINLLELLYAK